jgi:hypothetical protein
MNSIDVQCDAKKTSHLKPSAMKMSSNLWPFKTYAEGLRAFSIGALYFRITNCKTPLHLVSLAPMADLFVTTDIFVFGFYTVCRVK